MRQLHYFAIYVIGQFLYIFWFEVYFGLFILATNLNSNDPLFGIALANWQGKLQATFISPLHIASDNEIASGNIV